jgi:carboxypeptidase C (cathepsin A)
MPPSPARLPLAAMLLGLAAAAPQKPAPATPAAPPAEPARPTHLTPFTDSSDGTVTVGGKSIAYTARVGTIVVYPKDHDDLPQDHPADLGTGSTPPEVAATMSYVAYFKKGAPAPGRPITFLYNGGPGSSTVWLHMGAFGPRRVVTADDTHTAAAPYTLVDNTESLLDVSDLVFVDMPGTGFGRIEGPEDTKTKPFYGIDQDAHAFAEFIQSFLTQYNRWNSPKYIFGESYGTTRSAVLSNLLENEYDIDLNGVILLSQILDFAGSPDDAESNPGVDLPYILALPSYAAIAWYHHKLPPEANPPASDAALPDFLKQVETFATGPYNTALAAGNALSQTDRDRIAQQLHLYTGLPVAYLEKANLRVEGGEFEKQLLGAQDETTGRLDARFAGPSIDPLGKEADYDPQSAAISSAYVSSFNDYVRNQLHYAGTLAYKPELQMDLHWDMKHTEPGADGPPESAVNVMPDLAAAMKTNPLLKVQLDQGYFDLATPYFQGVWEMNHLPIPPSLQRNIGIYQYASGHMVYAHAPSLQRLHDNVAKFIEENSVHPAPQ